MVANVIAGRTQAVQDVPEAKLQRMLLGVTNLSGLFVGTLLFDLGRDVMHHVTVQLPPHPPLSQFISLPLEDIVEDPLVELVGDLADDPLSVVHGLSWWSEAV